MNKIIITFVFISFTVLLLAQNEVEIKKANNIMQQAAISLLVDKDYYIACDYYKQASDIYVKNGGRTNRKYLEAIKGMGDCYVKLNNLQKAISCYRILLKYSDIWQLDYVCLQLGRLYKEQNNIDAAISAYEDGLIRYRINGGRWNNNYYTIFKELFYLYYNQENVKEAIRVGEELCTIIEVDRPRWIAISSDLATIHQLSGNMIEAMKLYQDILSVYILDADIYLPENKINTSVAVSEELIKVLSKHNNLKYKSFAQQYNIAITIYNIGLIYYEIGNKEKSIEHLNIASSILQDINSANNSYYINLLIRLSTIYSDLLEHDKAVNIANEAYNMAKQYYLEKEIQLSSLINLANILLSANKENEAILCLNKALDNYPDNKSKANIYNSFSAIYRNNNIYTKAIEYAKKSVSIHKDPLYLNNLSILYLEQKKYKEASIPMIESWEMTASQIQQLFIQNREEDRAHIWNKYKEFIKAPINFLEYNVSDDVLKYAFNSLLFTKSIQLASSIDFRNIIRNSSDNQMIQIYQQWLDTPHDHVDYKKIEYDLLSRLQRLDYRSNLFNIRCDDIKNKLKREDLVIEFAYIQNSDTNEDVYYALLLHRDWSAPKCVRIDRGINKLKEYELVNLYSSSEIGNLVWLNIKKVIQNSELPIKNIYFIPDGVLYQISIEYMLCDEKRMSDMYNMRRLSSSRELVLERKSSFNKSAVLFGGIDYNTTIEDMEYYSSTISEQRSNNIGIWSYLPGTKQEILEISSILEENKYITKTHYGASCVEETFKFYSNKSPEIVHIATHGFYLPYEENNLKLDSVEFRENTHEDNMLQRCGLVFAGANNVVLGNRNIPKNIDDGILSASEIVNLDLFNTHLVVMSACQTGLGFVNDDGVFGLQRAFKKAGVKSILMTLWSVDDVVTQKLMIEFYKGITNGLSKYDALKLAQQNIKKMIFIDKAGKKYSGNNPYYWAPFVILD